MSLRSTVALLTLLAGCGEAAAPPVAEPTFAVPAEAPSTPRVSASVLLVTHDEVANYGGPEPRPKRTRADAAALAADLVARARANPGSFGDLVRAHSEAPEAVLGGYAGTWPAGEAPAGLESVEALAIGAVGDPVDTPLGFMIPRREPAPDADFLAARRLVVAWAGADRAPPGVTRSKDEALERARALRERAIADPGSFEALVRAESDGWDADRGGFLGTWEVEAREVPPSYDVIVGSMAEQAVSEPFETRYGYEVLQRLPAAVAPRQLSGAHVLISWAGAEKSTATRTKDEARALADEVLAKAKADPASFGVLAAEHSDDATATDGGALGAWKPGTRMPKAIDEAMLALGTDEVGGPVETKYGFHVLVRRASPEDKDQSYRKPERTPGNMGHGVHGGDTEHTDRH